MIKTSVKISLFGLPGAGKGTQAQKLARETKLPHISTGEMFRAIKHSDTDIANEIKSVLDSGRLVSDDLVVRLTFERLQQEDCTNGFILDGFPRTLSQAQDLQKSQFAINSLILLKISKDEIINRLSGRRVCEKCSNITHIDALKGDEARCPIDSGRLIQRRDDKPQAVATRLEIFEQNFFPVIEFFRESGRLIEVDASGNEEEVFERLLKSIDKINS